MPRKNADVIAKELLENPADFLPESAMKHVEKAQEEMAKALEEISKFADEEYLEKHQKEFDKMYKAIYPATVSNIDFSKKVMDTVSSNLHDYEVSKTREIIKLEKDLYDPRGSINEKDIMSTRKDILDKIQGMISVERRPGEIVDPTGNIAIIPAAVAAGAAAVAAAVEVVTLVRSVTSSNYIDRLIRTQRLNPKVLDLKHTDVLDKVKNINLMRRGRIR